MDEPLNSGSARLDRQPLRRLHVHGMKRLRSALDVKTDRIHHAVSAGKRIGDRPLVVDVGFDRFKWRAVDTEWHAVRMPRCDSNGKRALAQVPSDASAEKSGSAENGDSAPFHGSR